MVKTPNHFTNGSIPREALNIFGNFAFTAYWGFNGCNLVGQPQQATTHHKQLHTGGTAQRDEHIGLVTHQTLQSAAEGKQTTTGGSQTKHGRYHDMTLRASASILSSSFTPSRPPCIFSGLSRTSTLLVYGSNLTENGRLIPAMYVLLKDEEIWRGQKTENIRSTEFKGEVVFELFIKLPR